MKRRPKCHTCQKPLGGTAVECYECSDETDSKDLTTAENWRRYWLIELGVPKETIQRHQLVDV